MTARSGHAAARRILVTGRRGQVGWELERSLQPLGEVLALGREAFDLSAPDALAPRIRELAPEVIVNAAAYTAVDAAEDDEAGATRVNGEAVGVIAATAQELGALLVHYSTDYVFDGSGDAPRSEAEASAPINAYGRSKLAGERAALDSGADCLVLRTSWVFGARGRNFLCTMLGLARERESLRVVDDQIGAPTSARLIADVTAQVVQASLAQRATGRFHSEVLHLAARGETSWCGFARASIEQARALLPDGAIAVRRIDPIATADWPAAARRPLNSRLAVDRIETRFGLRLPHWEHGMRLCVEDWVARLGREAEAR